MGQAFVRLLAAVLLSAFAAGGAAAHEIRPAIVSASFGPDGRYALAIEANLEMLIIGIGPQHNNTNESALAAEYDKLRILPPDELKRKAGEFLPRWLAGIHVEFDGKRVTPRVAAIEIPPVGEPGLERLSMVRLAGDIPPGARTFRWSYGAEFGSSVLRVKKAGSDDIVATWLKDGKASDPVPLAGSRAKTVGETFFEYLRLGFAHIVPEGVDHILFVLGLYLLSTHIKPLLIQVTAFTVAHSITLGLGLYGIVTVSPAIVEPLIALSIVYVAVENIFTSRLHSWRPLVVFCFGLLHGLGFAGVLHEIGLPRADYLTGLVSFNVGVELGQLTVIAMAFAVTGLWFHARPWYRARIVIPASAAIALVGMFWTVERVVAG